MLRHCWVSVLLQIPLLYLTDKYLAGLSREPFAVSFISPKVFALRQEDDGQCDRAVSTETRCEFCVLFFLFFTCTMKHSVTNVRDPHTQSIEYLLKQKALTCLFCRQTLNRNNIAHSVCSIFAYCIHNTPLWLN